jgi:adenine-specific DNA-methyltransferase
VTNNEVAEKRANELEAEDVFPGSPAFEANGIADAVTWPRCKYVVKGRRGDGSDLPGTYLDGRSLSVGLSENVEYFRVDFLDPDEVARGDAFKAIAPILWMMAGCSGEREDSKGSTPWFIPKHSPFAVLIQDKQFPAFRAKLAERKDIELVFIITDSEENFGEMRRTLGPKYECRQLYKSYLENFRINTNEALNG